MTDTFEDYELTGQNKKTPRDYNRRSTMTSKEKMRNWTKRIHEAKLLEQTQMLK